MPVRITQIKHPTAPGAAVAKEPVQLTPEQKARLQSAFAKAVVDTLGESKVAWISGGFSKSVAGDDPQARAPAQRRGEG